MNKDCFVNNHIHTTYSFSPYTPREAVLKAKEAGLRTAGLMDHDSIGGAAEFIAAGEEFGLPVTVGLETRVTVKGTFL
ncbi:MAG: PHP domain-containing protein, partial [Firmicutes bacterium]|nr:PHP domain-containing protein [Bacillota bacterium]